MNASPFLTVPQLAKHLCVKPATIYEMTRLAGPGSIPRYRLGKRLVFDLAEVIVWIKTTRDERTRGIRGRRGAASSRRASQVLTTRQRRVPDAVSEGRKRDRPTAMRVSGDSHISGAAEVPSSDV